MASRRALSLLDVVAAAPRHVEGLVAMA